MPTVIFYLQLVLPHLVKHKMQTQVFIAKPGALTGLFLPLFGKFYKGYIGEIRYYLNV